jgi:hypothetical protein
MAAISLTGCTWKEFRKLQNPEALEGPDRQAAIDSFRGVDGDSIAEQKPQVSGKGGSSDLAAAESESAKNILIQRESSFLAAQKAAEDCVANDLGTISANPLQPASQDRMKYPGATFNQGAADCTQKSFLYFQAGLSLSDDLCRLFFNDAAKYRADANETRDIANAIGTLTSAILGLTGAGSLATGAAGVAFGTFESGINASVANYLFSADPGQVEDLVFKQREVLVKQYERGKNITNFYDARRALAAYNQTCAPVSVRNLVNTSIQNSVLALERQSSPTTNELSAIDRAAIGGLADKVRALLKNEPVVTNDDMISIYAIFVRGGLPATVWDQRVARLRAEAIVDPNTIALIVKDEKKRKEQEQLIVNYAQTAATISGFDGLLDQEVIAAKQKSSSPIVKSIPDAQSLLANLLRAGHETKDGKTYGEKVVDEKITPEIIKSLFGIFSLRDLNDRSFQIRKQALLAAGIIGSDGKPIFYDASADAQIQTNQMIAIVEAAGAIANYRQEMTCEMQLLEESKSCGNGIVAPTNSGTSASDQAAPTSPTAEPVTPPVVNQPIQPVLQ